VFVHPDAGPDEDLIHPIPRLDTLDALVESDQGARIAIVIATPLLDDARSRARLQRKFEVSMAYFGSPKFREKHGPPNPHHCKLYFSVHASSDVQMIEIIQQLRPQVECNGIAFSFRLTSAN
jgi:hypothetical protein